MILSCILLTRHEHISSNHHLQEGFFIHKGIISAVKRAEFVTRMSYIILRGRSYNIFIPNVHAPPENKSDDKEDKFYEEPEHIFVWSIAFAATKFNEVFTGNQQSGGRFDRFPTKHKKIFLEDSNQKVGREDTFKLTIGNEYLHETSNNNGVRVVNFATSKHTTVKKNKMFQHRKIHKYIWTYLNGMTHNQIDHDLIDWRL
jgi:hypothetical protein